MKLFDRSDRSTFGMWIWNIDFKLFGMILLLIVSGIMLLMSAVSVENSFILKKQLFFLCLALPTILFFSFLDIKLIRRISFFALLVCLVMVIYTITFGEEIKGARRWIKFYEFSIQPSEFIKPFFAVINAWLLSIWIEQKNFPGWLFSITLTLFILILLLLQPDVGMSFLIASSWFLQIYLSGLSLYIIAFLTFSSACLFVVFYNFSLIAIFLPHVQKRIEEFWYGGGYQIEKSLNAFSNGGLYGQGFGEGSIKNLIPDRHTDFIFSIAGEELGVIGASLILIAYAVIFIRVMLLTSRIGDVFILICCSTLIMQFFLQAAVHMSSTLNMIPTKGMTLPFISYGGSSLISSSISIGIILAMTRKNYFWKSY